MEVAIFQRIENLRIKSNTTMKTFISIVFLTVTVSLFSQNPKIDSLQVELTLAKGHKLILVLNELANECGYLDFKKSIRLANEALRLAVIQKYYDTQARSFNIIGRAYYISNNFKVADKYYDKGMATAKKYNTPDDIYKSLRLKTLLYVNGYIPDSIVTKAVFKKYIQLTVEKKNDADFIETLRLYSYVYDSQPYNILEITKYLDNLKIRMKDNSEFLSAIYASEGFLFKKNLEYYNAIEKFEKAIKLTKDISKKTIYLERIGVIYFEVRKYKESIKYFKDALQLVNTNKFEKKDFSLHLLEADLGASYLKTKDYKIALSYLQKALMYNYFVNTDKGIVCSNIGIAYLSLGYLEKAEFYLNKSITIFDNFKINSEKLGSLNCKAEMLKRKQKWSQLSEVINEIIKLVNDVKDYYIVYDSYQLLSNYYEESGNYKKSNEYLKKWITANDSINNRELVNKMKEFEFKYETEKKEQQIALQQSTIRQKDQFIVFQIIVVCISFVAMLIIFILYKKKNQAYKLLVFQSLKNTNTLQLLSSKDQSNEVNAPELICNISRLDEGLKKQIEISLKIQLESKIFIDSNLTIKMLAVKCSTNRSYFSQFIHEQYNMNFNTFINTLRINEAKLILADKDSNIPLKELYLRLGFNTYSVFNEAFKKHVGVTPAFYLKTVKDLNIDSNVN